jgi:O-6-methylguanine DNA methyltransferase
MIQVYSRNFNDLWFGLAIGNQQVYGTSFGESEQKVLGSLLNSLPFNVSFQVFSEPSAYAKDLFAFLADIYEGKNVNFNFPLSIERLPAYTQRVLNATMAIPVGYVTSYGSIAKAVGGGPRAVGNIMANNTFAPIVPCHRVVKSDLMLGGYGGGLKVKYQLLSRERRGYASDDIIEVDSWKMHVFPVEFALKKFDSFF